MTDPIHPIGPRDRDVAPVQRLQRQARDAHRDQTDPEGGQGRERPPERHGAPQPEPDVAPNIDDGGNPHIDVRV